MRKYAKWLAALVLSCTALNGIAPAGAASSTSSAASNAATSASAPSCPKRLLVLVPGFFSQPGRSEKEAPPYDEDQLSGFIYFSNDILGVAREKGFAPWVVRDLDRFGDFAFNGERLLRDLRAISGRFPGCPLTVLAHSAGGIYTAYALTKDPSLPIKTVVTLGTPYQGSELTNLITWVPGWQTITEWLNLKSLREFRRDLMPELLRAFRIPAKVRWVALGGSQKPCFLLSCSDARSLSWILTMAWNFTSLEGDGVVDIESARAKDVSLPTASGGFLKPEQWPDLKIPLDHWKITQEASRFSFLGVRNPEWIRDEQRRIYREILGRI
jgi:hypothetical protein